MTPYAVWTGTHKRAGWTAEIKDADHGKVIWTSPHRHPTLREALAEAEAQHAKLLKELT
jgi:hypothetical protein